MLTSGAQLFLISIFLSRPLPGAKESAGDEPYINASIDLQRIKVKDYEMNDCAEIRYNDPQLPEKLRGR